MTSKVTQRIWVIIPAAGIGRRMQQQTPKQYLTLAGRPVLAHTLDIFLTRDDVKEVIVATDPSDSRWQTLKAVTDTRVNRVDGGADRQDSVQAALLSLKNKAQAEDWVWVHDAVRPCTMQTELDTLKKTLSEHAVGGILATPLSNTLKQCDDAQHIQHTIPRAQLWQALTPQMFRYEILCSALQHATEKKLTVTDEASAVEHLGLTPDVVLGETSNIKLTYPSDLKLAEFYLGQGA